MDGLNEKDINNSTSDAEVPECVTAQCTEAHSVTVRKADNFSKTESSQKQDSAKTSETSDSVKSLKRSATCGGSKRLSFHLYWQAFSVF